MKIFAAKVYGLCYHSDVIGRTIVAKSPCEQRIEEGASRKLL